MPEAPAEVLEAPHGLLSRTRESDADQLAHAVGASLDHLRRWLSWATEEADDVQAQRRRCREAEAHWAHGSEYAHVLRPGQSEALTCGGSAQVLSSSLDDVGHRQARRLGTVLGSRVLSAVVASPLRRARETAQPVADRAGREVATDRRLIDRDYGRWAGTRRESVVARVGLCRRRTRR
jgi:hypothetical protein